MFPHAGLSRAWEEEEADVEGGRGKDPGGGVQKPGRQHDAACGLPVLLGPIQDSLFLEEMFVFCLKLDSVVFLTCNFFLKVFLISLNEWVQVWPLCWRVVYS